MWDFLSEEKAKHFTRKHLYTLASASECLVKEIISELSWKAYRKINVTFTCVFSVYCILGINTLSTFTLTSPFHNS